MNIAELLNLFDWALFLPLYVGILLVASLLFRPVSYGVFDVAWIVIAAQSVGVTLVVYLDLTMHGHLKEHSIFMLLALLGFLLGARVTHATFLYVRPQRPQCVVGSFEIVFALRQLRRILAFLQFLILALVLLRASTQGLPIFMADPEMAKVEVNSGGFGLITRIQTPSVTLAFSIIFLLQSLGHLRGGKLLLAMLPALIALLASGSKGALLAVLISYTAVQAYLMGLVHGYKPPSSTRVVIYVAVTILGYAAVVLLLRAIGTGEDDPWLFVVTTFGVRLIAFGDGVFYYFVNDLFRTLSFDPSDYFWDYILNPLMALLRLVDYPISLGLKISGEMFGQEKLGPNPTMYVEGYAYFGALGGLFYAACLGVVFQILRSNVFSRFRSFSIWNFIGFVLLFSLAQLVPSDMLLFHADLVNSILLASMVWLANNLIQFLFPPRPQTVLA